MTSKFEPHLDERGQIVTFLICESLSFDIVEKLDELLACYVEEHPKWPANLRHNLILSIKQGLISYLHPSGALFPFPLKSTEVAHFDDTDEPQRITIEPRRMKNRLVLAPPDSFEHLRHFSTMLYQALTAVSVLFPDMGRYIQAQHDVLFKDVDPID